MTFFDNIILGCGPAGLQLGYFFKQHNQNYIILEKNNQPASFFTKYPHSKELISINKKYTGHKNKEFNLRHDWNSLLNNHELQMTDFSDNFYPSRDELTNYLEAFVNKYQLNIHYNTHIIHIIKQDNLFTLTDNKNNTWTCNNLIIATGLSKPNIPNILNIEYSKHYSEFPLNYFLSPQNLNKYKNKKVAIIGNGNSAFELANLLTPYCSTILILGRKSPTPSLVTHYTGDLRSKYFHFYDTFLLKSLNAFDSHCVSNKLSISKHSDNLLYLERTCDCQCPYYRDPVSFHEIINCTGWTFDTSIFDPSITPNIEPFYNKYPEITGKYESTNVKNLFFIGTLMHSFDYKKSSGGFIHGFRYLIDNFVKINFTNFTSIQLNTLSSLCSHFYKRINTSSALYQMHSQLCDIFYLHNDTFIYYEQIPLSYIFTYNNDKITLPSTNIFILTLEYGNDLQTDIKKIGSRTTSVGSENKALLIHPVLRIYNNKSNTFGSNHSFYPSYDTLSQEPELIDIIHFDEDLLTNFTNKDIYLQKFFKIIKGYI